MKPFAIGFTGSSLTELLPWVDEQVGDAERVVVAMAGSGKDIAYLAREGRTITSWDPQPLSRYIVDGVFGAPAELPAPVDFEYVHGYATDYEPIRGMPRNAALLADHIASNGSDYDRACLAKALIRSTYMGRLGVWGRGLTDLDLYVAYGAAYSAMAAHRGLPGVFTHTEGSCFASADLWAALNGATLLIDTPKVLTSRKKGGDIYSQGFNGLNSILAQRPIELPGWTEQTFRHDMPLLWTAPWKRMIFFHATGCLPSPLEVAELMVKDNVPLPLDYREWPHKGRTDVAWVIERNAVPAPPIADGQLVLVP